MTIADIVAGIVAESGDPLDRNVGGRFMLIVKTIVGLATQMLVLAALLLIPAGTFHWNDALNWLSVWAVAAFYHLARLRLRPTRRV